MVFCKYVLDRFKLDYAKGYMDLTKPETDNSLASIDLIYTKHSENLDVLYINKKCKANLKKSFEN